MQNIRGQKERRNNIKQNKYIKAEEEEGKERKFYHLPIEFVVG